MLKTSSISYYIAGLCGLIIITHSLLHHLGGTDPVNVISWDVYGYYVYLPAVFNYSDPVYYSFLTDHFENYSISGNLYQVQEVVDGRKAPIYTIGLAIIWLPMYTIANIIAWVSPSYAMDGLSGPYQWGIIVTCWVFTLMGIFYLRKVLLHLVSDRITALVLIFIFLGTNYYHYAVFENGMSHTYLLSLYAVLLYYTIQWHQKPSYRSTILIGTCIALLCLARPSEVVSLFIPLFYGVYSLKTLQEKIISLTEHWRMLGVLTLTGIGVVLIQILYWKFTIGLWFNNGYAGHHFDFLQPHLWDGIFSYRKGWLLYTPIMTFAIIGLIPLFFYEKKWRISILSYCLLNIYIVLSWHIWWYASSFGMRALVQSYAVLAIPLAVLFDRLSRYRWALSMSIVFGIFCLGLNHFQDWQYRHRILAMDEMTKTFYWNAWGKTSFNGDDYKYIDNDERLPSRFSGKGKIIAAYNAENDSSNIKNIQPHLGKRAFMQTPERTFGPGLSITVSSKTITSLQDKWVAVEGELLNAGSRFAKYKAAKLVFSLERKGETIKWRGVRFQRYRPRDQWLDLTYHLQLPNTLQVGDLVKVYVWNQSPDTIYIHQLRLRLMEE